MFNILPPTELPHGHTLKARTHRPILRGFEAESAVGSADSIPESADFTTDFTIVGRLSISNMFNILKPLVIGRRESADYCSRPMANGPSGYGPLVKIHYLVNTDNHYFSSADLSPLLRLHQGLSSGNPYRCRLPVVLIPNDVINGNVMKCNGKLWYSPIQLLYSKSFLVFNCHYSKNKDCEWYLSVGLKNISLL